MQTPCKPHANMHTGTHVAHHARLVPTLGAPRVAPRVAPHVAPRVGLWPGIKLSTGYPQANKRGTGGGGQRVSAGGVPT